MIRPLQEGVLKIRRIFWGGHYFRVHIEVPVFWDTAIQGLL